jgi:hypothetical protein
MKPLPQARASNTFSLGETGGKTSRVEMVIILKYSPTTIGEKELI